MFKDMYDKLEKDPSSVPLKVGFSSWNQVATLYTLPGTVSTQNGPIEQYSSSE